MDNSTVKPGYSTQRLASQLCVALLTASLAAICLALVVLVGGSLLADYYDARHVTWRVPSPLEEYPVLLGIACMFLGFTFRAFSGKVISRRIRIMMILTFVTFVPLLFVIFGKARPNYPPTICSNNQRSLAMGMIMYAQDHGNRLPRQLSDIRAYVEPDDLVCPLSKRAFHGTLGYGLNSSLSGMSLSDLEKIPNPSSILLTADSIQPNMLITSITDIDTTRHVALKVITKRSGDADSVEDLSQPRGFVASFADGHVEFVTDGDEVRLK